MINALNKSWLVVLRNWMVYRKDLVANISPTLVEPCLLLVALGFGLAPFVQEVNGMSYVKFLAPGLIATVALFTAYFESSYGFYVRMTYESVFKAMLSTPLSVSNIVAGELIWNFLKAALMGLAVALLMLALGVLERPLALLFLPLIGGLIALPLGAIGLISCGLVRNMNQFQGVYSFVVAPMYFLSGVFFPIETTPRAYQIAIEFSPFYQGLRLMQLTFWGGDSIRVEALLWHFTMLCLLSLPLCWLSLRLIRRRLQL